MLRPSGETWGSAAHWRSKTSSGLKAGFGRSAKLGALKPRRAKAVAANCRHIDGRLPIGDLFAGRPAVTLMFIHNPHRLHEGVANSWSDEFKAFLFEILAHRVAMRRRLYNIAEIQGPAAQHLTIGKPPDVVTKGPLRGADLEVRACIRSE